MFSKSAPLYWDLYCHVGGASKLDDPRMFGLGCRVAPAKILTAAHVFHGSAYPVALLSDGLWKCSVIEQWPDLDIALLRADLLLKSKGEANEPTNFPHLAARPPALGTSIGYVGWLTLHDENGEQSGRTYFGQGHVAFFEFGEGKQILLGVEGSSVERGFSGGPAFSSNGDLVGLTVEALQYAPKIGKTVRQFNALPLVSSLSPISKKLGELIGAD